MSSPRAARPEGHTESTIISKRVSIIIIILCLFVFQRTGPPQDDASSNEQPLGEWEADLCPIFILFRVLLVAYIIWYLSFQELILLTIYWTSRVASVRGIFHLQVTLNGNCDPRSFRAGVIIIISN